jgi:hypothetical protein
MTYSTTIAELHRAGIAIRPSEAVAIAQKLINDPHHGFPRPPFGPPSTENVIIDELGNVTCSTCAVRPAVSEIAILLDAMLPEGTRLPGGLRYLIARALLNVDAPPFDSVEEFSSALSRFERSDNGVVIRDLVERARAMSSAPAPAAVIPFKASPAAVRFRTERRQGVPSAVAADLRRELHRADLERYARQVATTFPDLRGALHHHRRPISTVVAGLSAGIMLIASGEAIHREGAGVAASIPNPAITAPVPQLPEPAVSLPLPANINETSDMRPSRSRPPIGSIASVSRRSPLRASSVERQRRSPRAVGGETGSRNTQRAHQSGRARDARRARPTGLLGVLRLQWIRNLITIRDDL